LTTYYVRAYATNSAGTAYGPEVSFTTPQAIVTLWVAGDFQGWNPGAATDSLMNTSDNQLVRGYVYLPNTNGFKFVSQKNWDGPNYGAAIRPKIRPMRGRNLRVSSPGYYYLTLDLANLTYTATKITWGGLVGNAGGWDADRQWFTARSSTKGWPHFVNCAEYKFRATVDDLITAIPERWRFGCRRDKISRLQRPERKHPVEPSSPIITITGKLVEYHGDAAGGWVKILIWFLMRTTSGL
jgi:hypothetical protein